MLKSVFYLIAALIIPMAAVTGCHRNPVAELLNRADSLMTSRPDSAMRLLLAVDTAAIKGEQRARHALLLSQAYDKNYIDTPDRSLINIAYDFYRHNTDSRYDRERMMAFFYHGAVDYNATDYQSSIYNLTIADTLAARQNDLRFRALANARLASAYGELAFLRKELEYAKKSLDFFQQTGDSAWISLQNLNVAKAYMQVHEFDTALKYYRLADQDRAAFLLGRCYIEMGDLDRFDNHLLKYPYLKEDILLTCRYANVLTNRGQLEEAEKLIHHAEEVNTDTIEPDIIKYSKTILLGKRKEWHDYAKALETRIFEDHVTIDRVEDENVPVAMTQAKEYITASDNEKARARQQTMVITVSGVTVALIILILLYIIRVITARKKQETLLRRLAHLSKEMASNEQKHLNEVMEMTREMNELQQRSQPDTDASDDSLSAARDALFIEEHKQTLNSIYDTFILTPSTPEGREMKKNLLQQIKDYSRPDFMAVLENVANRRFDNIVTRIRTLGFKANEIALLCYIVNGFSLAQIAVIMEVEPPTLSTRKSRLKAKLRSAGVSSPLPGFQLGSVAKN